MRRCTTAVAAVLALSAACGARREPLPVFSTVPEFVLTAQDGREFRSEAELKGHVWVADFIFTNCPGPCKRMSTQMKVVQGQLRDYDAVRFVSFSVDPDRDTPEALAEYAKRYSADSARWFFLTGSRKDLHQLMRYSFLLGDVDGSLTHSTRFALVDRTGRVRRYYETNEDGFLTNLVRDARFLAEERG